MFAIKLSDKRNEVPRRQLIIDGRLKPSELIRPGIHVNAQLPEAQLLVHMLSAGVCQIRIQQDLPEPALLKQRADEQAQDDLPQPLVLLRRSDK